MALNPDRLKGKIIDLLNNCRNENDNPDRSRDLFAEKLAKAIVEEIKQASLNYTTGLVAPTNGGAVTGTLKNVTIE